MNGFLVLQIEAGRFTAVSTHNSNGRIIAHEFLSPSDQIRPEPGRLLVLRDTQPSLLVSPSGITKQKRPRP